MVGIVFNRLGRRICDLAERVVTCLLEHVFTDGILNVGLTRYFICRCRFDLCAILVCDYERMRSLPLHKNGIRRAKIRGDIWVAKFDHTKTTTTELIELAICYTPRCEVVINIEVRDPIISTFEFLLVFKTNRYGGCQCISKGQVSTCNRNTVCRVRVNDVTLSICT